MKTLQKHFIVYQYNALLAKANSWLAQLPAKILPPHIRLKHIASAYRESRLLYVAAKLDIAEELATDKVPITALTDSLGLNPEYLGRVLHALASIGIFHEVQPQVFANNSLSTLLRDSHKNTVRHDILFNNNEEISSLWFDNTCIESASLYELGENLDESPSENVGTDLPATSLAQASNAYPQSLNNQPISVSDSKFDEASYFLHNFDWSLFDYVFDAGNALSSHSLSILQCDDKVNICICDSARKIRQAKQNKLHPKGLNTMMRMSFEEANVFSDLPKANSTKNLYCFFKVFHQLSDQQCLSVLDNTHRAMGSFCASVAIMETVLPVLNSDRELAFEDMQLFLQKRAKQRTMAQWKLLFDQSAFTLYETVKLEGSRCVLVLKPTA